MEVNTTLTLGARLSILHRLGSVALAARAKRLGLAAGQHAYLLAIHDGVATSQEALAAHFQVDKGNVARAVARLHAAGLVARRRRSGDRRAYCLSLTPAGLERVPLVRGMLKDWDSALMRGVSPRDRRTLGRLLAAMEANAADHARLSRGRGR